MPTYATAVSESVYLLNGRRGRRYAIYLASAIGNPFAQEADRWNFMPYPAPLWYRPGPAFDSAAAAEVAALAWDDGADRPG